MIIQFLAHIFYVTFQLKCLKWIIICAAIEKSHIVLFQQKCWWFIEIPIRESRICAIFNPFEAWKGEQKIMKAAWREGYGLNNEERVFYLYQISIHLEIENWLHEGGSKSFHASHDNLMYTSIDQWKCSEKISIFLFVFSPATFMPPSFPSSQIKTKQNKRKYKC